jgi:acyl-coenzyme A thioesterase PaaI-like protein
MTRDRFLRLAQSPRFTLFLLWKLPAAWFMGVRVERCTAAAATVRVPYGWRSQNPFRSTYFAAQVAAAEMSTGLLAMAALQGRPAVSMLVVSLAAEFLKKARETVFFTCEDGPAVEAAVERALATGEAQMLTMQSVGRLPDGSVAARIGITWSFKIK